VNGKLEIICNEAVVVWLKYSHGIILERLQ